MTARNPEDRARDIELIADAVTGAVRAALPALVRREVTQQLSARETSSVKSYSVAGGSSELPPHPWPPTLPRPGKK